MQPVRHPRGRTNASGGSDHGGSSSWKAARTRSNRSGGQAHRPAEHETWSNDAAAPNAGVGRADLTPELGEKEAFGAAPVYRAAAPTLAANKEVDILGVARAVKWDAEVWVTVLRSDLSSVGAQTVVVPGDYDEGSAGGRVGDWPEGADASHAGSRCVPAEPRRIRADVPPWRATDGPAAARGLRRAVAGAMARAEVHGPTTVAIGLLGASPVAHRSSSDSPEGLEWPEDEAAAAVVTGILEWAATQGRSSIAQVLETCAQIES